MSSRPLWALIFFLLSAPVFALNETTLAQSLGLDLISEGTPFNYLGINRIYVNETLSRQMLVVANAPGAVADTQVIRAKDFYVVQFPTSKETFTSIALVGITESEIQQQIKTTSVWKTIWRELSPLKRAYGEVPCPTPSQQSSLSELQNFFGSTVAKGAMTCMSSLLQGVWDSTGGMVQGAWNGLKNLVADPSGWWEEKVNQMRNLKNFVLNFETKMRQMASTLVNLPAETKTMLICSFIGSLGTDIALAVLTGGAGAASVMLRMEGYLSKVMRMERVLTLLNRVGKLRSAPPEFFRRLASGRVPDDVVNNIGVFANHNLPDVAVGAMACAL